MTVRLERFKEEYAEVIWRVGFSKETPEWKKWDGPYFEDYKPYATFEAFRQSDVWRFLTSPSTYCILVSDEPIGVVTRYWENEKTRWMEIGIVIYNENYWHSGYGKKALQLWTSQTFAEVETIEHLGLTTWSGNKRMMGAAERIGYMKEAQIRKVRYWQGHYYDSVKYGILRSEWQDHMNKTGTAT